MEGISPPSHQIINRLSAKRAHNILFHLEWMVFIVCCELFLNEREDVKM